MRIRATNRLAAGTLAVGAGIGAVTSYFLDPDRGRSRRAVTANRLAGLVRRSIRRAGRGYRYAVGSAAGAGKQLVHRPVNQGSMNVNAEHGTVVLRGVAESQDQIERIMLATMGIDGVRTVRSLLRLHSDVAPGPAVEPAHMVGAGAAAVTWDGDR